MILVILTQSARFSESETAPRTALLSLKPELKKPLHPALANLPPVMIWAWERREDLRWLKSDNAGDKGDKIGVAYVMTSIKLIGNAAYVRPRLNPVFVPKGTIMVPVIHVDPSFVTPPDLTEQQMAVVVAQLVSAVPYAQAKVIQLDFEVWKSQRSFLAELVRRARRALPPDIALSMTALASWCMGDRWLGNLPADEIVPMIFRMGEHAKPIRAQLAQTGRVTDPVCRHAAGYAIDEPFIALTTPRRYFFAPQALTEQTWQKYQGNLPGKSCLARLCGDLVLALYRIAL